jgi:hypothetical protein
MDTAAPATNDILQWNGTAWKPAAPATAQINAGPGLSKSGNTLSALTGTALWNAAQLQSFAVSSNTPGRSDVLQWNGSAWTPAALPTAGIVARNGLQKSGDTLDAQSSNAIWNASRLQGNAISSTSPATDDVLKWNGSTWAPGRASGGSSISCSTTSNSNYSVRGTGSGGWECTDAIWITSGKQVGIGTTSPSTSFDLTVGTSGFLVNGTTTTSKGSVTVTATAKGGGPASVTITFEDGCGRPGQGVVPVLVKGRPDPPTSVTAEAVDDGTGLFAGAAVRLLETDRLTRLLLPMLGKGTVELRVKLPRRIIGDVEDARRTRAAGEQNEQQDEEQRSNESRG